jgi:hypothetical protein
LKQNNTNDRTAPRSNKIPIAIPAFPATLIPPELGLGVALDVELATDIVEEVSDDVVGKELSVAARREAEGGTEVWPGVIAVGRPVELEEVVVGALVSTITPVSEAPSVGGDDVTFGSCEGAEVVVATAGVCVDQPPIGPGKVFEAVTYIMEVTVDAACCVWSLVVPSPKNWATALARGSGRAKGFAARAWRR